MSDGGILTFTNLFPSSVMPTHGLFVRERMQRVAAHSGLPWQVVAPVPRVPWPLCRGEFRLWAAVPEREVHDGVEVHHPRYLHLPGVSQRRQAARMAAAALPVVRRLGEERRWVIDAHYLYPDGVAAARVARALQWPYLLTARGSDVHVLGRDPRCAAAIGAAARGATACLAVSEPLCRRFAELVGWPDERVVLVRNGVDLQRFRPGDPRVSRRALGLPTGPPLLLGVGRLVAGKGFHLAAKALASLPAARLVLVGDGPEQSRIAAIGGDRVHFLGSRSPAEVAEAYRACDLLVLPSEREGWPNVVTEALASGLPVVATAVGGIPQILGEPLQDDLSRGALVPPGDGVALAAALAAVLAVPRDPAAVRAFAQRYSWDEPVALLADRFRQALGGGTR